MGLSIYRYIKITQHIQDMSIFVATAVSINLLFFKYILAYAVLGIEPFSNIVFF